MALDAREVRGKAIADQGNQIKKVNDHSFKVKSQSGSKVYEVKTTPNGMTCDCPDCDFTLKEWSLTFLI
jgi:hypothetical protein